MTDLHTHILPGMDDGARSSAESMDMLRMEREQGIDTVALTPHFYPEQESLEKFLSRRAASYGKLREKIAALPDAERAQLPDLVLGAEVAWVSGLADMPGLEKLCYENSRYLLVELPFISWGDRLLRGLNDLMNRTGLTPMIAHIDRYYSLESTERLIELFGLGLPVQVSAESVHSFRNRHRSMQMLRSGACHLISDCHNTDTRRPDIGDALGLVRRKLGDNAVSELDARSDGLLGISRKNN